MERNILKSHFGFFIGALILFFSFVGVIAVSRAQIPILQGKIFFPMVIFLTTMFGTMLVYVPLEPYFSKKIKIKKRAKRK